MPNEYLPLPGTPVEELDTPALIIDLDIAESNINKLQAWASDNDVSIRPHSKTHKSPYWAHKQLKAGAIGQCAAKISEAEALAEGGVPEILVTTEQIGRQKITRVASLATWSRIIVPVDHEQNVRDLSEAAQAAGSEIGVILEINVGMNRCGVEPDEAAALAKIVDGAPGLRFDGVMGYEGNAVHIQDYEERKTVALGGTQKLLQAVDGIKKAGLPVEIVSAAGTGTYNFTGTVDGITELQCGSYIFMDGEYIEVLQDFELALTVLATVISRPVPERVVMDAGRKAVSVDQGWPHSVGVDGLEVQRLSEEHTLATAEGDARQLRVGDKVHLLPMHGDTTIAMHDYYFGVRNGRLETVIPITGRGRFT